MFNIAAAGVGRFSLKNHPITQKKMHTIQYEKRNEKILAARFLVVSYNSDRW
jgi:hypothetical protein